MSYTIFCVVEICRALKGASFPLPCLHSMPPFLMFVAPFPTSPHGALVTWISQALLVKRGGTQLTWGRRRTPIFGSSPTTTRCTFSEREKKEFWVGFALGREHLQDNHGCRFSLSCGVLEEAVKMQAASRCNLCSCSVSFGKQLGPLK